MKEIILNYGFEESFSFNDKNYERIGLEFYETKEQVAFKVIDFKNEGILPVKKFLEESNFIGKDLTRVAFVQNGSVIYEKQIDNDDMVDIVYSSTNELGHSLSTTDELGFGTLSITFNR